MAAPNLSAKIVDGVVAHSVNILRVAEGQRKAVLTMLEKLEVTLTAEVMHAAEKSAFTQARLKALLAQTKETIAEAYKVIAGANGTALAKIAQLEAVKTVNIINGAIGVGVATVGQSAEQLAAIAGKSLLQGKYPAEWWAKQDKDLQAKFADAMREGYLKGEGVDKLVQRVRGTKAAAYTNGLMLASKAQAEALVRTSIQTVANEARIATYLANITLIKGIQWIATLDNRTTPICQALDGLQWSIPDFQPVGHDKEFPGPVAHWQCRSTQIAVTKSWAELAGPKSQLKKDGKPIDLDAALQKKLEADGLSAEQAAKVKADTRASIDGQVAAATDFEAWLKGKPDEYVNAILGPQRAQLWREGKVSIRDMTDQSSRPLSIAELKAMIAKNSDVAPAVEGADGLPLHERKLLEQSLAAGISRGDQLTHYVSEAGERITITGTAPAADDLVKIKALGNVKVLTNTLNAGDVFTPQQVKHFAELPGFTGARMVTPTGKVLFLDASKPFTAAEANAVLTRFDALKNTAGTDQKKFAKAVFEEGPSLKFKMSASGAVAPPPNTFNEKFAESAKPAPFYDAAKEAEVVAAAQKQAADEAAAAAKALEAKAAAEKAAALKAANAQAGVEIEAAYGKFDPLSTAIVEVNEANRGAMSETEVLAAAKEKVAQEAAAKAEKEAAIAKAKQEAEAKAAAEAAAAAKAEQAAKEAQAAAAAAAEAKLHAEAQATIGEILANPKGQTLKAKAIGELMKAEPDLKPAELLAKAHAQAQEAANKSSIASALSGAKKKMLAGEAPSKYQAQVIAGLPADQKAAFINGIAAEHAAIESQKAAAAALQAAQEAAAKKALDDAAKATAAAQQTALESAKKKYAEASSLSAAANVWNDEEKAAFKGLKAKEKTAFMADAKKKYGLPAEPPTAPAAVATPIPTTPQPTHPIAPVNENAFPDTPGALQRVKGLGGSTGAELVRDPATGELYVRKAGADAGHIREEMTADRIYTAAGASVPEGRLYDTAAGPVKLTRYLGDDAETLASFYARATPAEIADVRTQLRKHFVLDALLANYDVAGAGNDNVLIVRGQAYRVDNGGALRYRAMGAPKGAAFGDKVLELDSMRDPKVNPNTAKIFAGITDAEVKAQVADLYSRKGEILAALPPELRARIDARLADLGQRFGVEPQVAVEPGGAAVYLPPDVGATVAKARINGHGRLGDTGDVEDLQTLTWQEKNAAGDLQTKVHLKVTFEGGQKIINTIGESVLSGAPELPGLKFDAGGYAPLTPAQLSKIHPKDKFFAPIENAAKTTATHAADGAYNPGTMQNFAAAKTQLAALAKDASLDAQGQKMVAHYQAQIAAIEAAQAKTGPLPTKGQFKQFEYKAPKGGQPPAATASSTAPAEGEIRVYRDNAHFELKRIVKGKAQVIDGYANEVLRTQSTPVYRIMVGPDVEIKFVRPSGVRTGNDNLALQGNVDVTVRAGASRESIARAHDALRRIGIDLTPPSAERIELVYLARGVTVLERSKGLPAGFTAIMNGAGTEAEKVTAAKKFIEKKYALKLPAKPTADYRPAGQVNGFDEGFRNWHRFDLPPAKVEEELKGYTLWHATGQGQSVTIDAILNSGGEFTTTTQRLRKGVSIGTRSAPIGMSPYSDLDTGGASYFFTRLRPPGGSQAGGIYFKIRNLARIDAVTFTGDKYGAIEKFGERKIAVADYKTIAAARGNDETIVKNGINLLDEVDFIKANSPTERKSILDVFKKHGYTHLPDGRKIEDVVK